MNASAIGSIRLFVNYNFWNRRFFRLEASATRSNYHNRSFKNFIFVCCHTPSLVINFFQTSYHPVEMKSRVKRSRLLHQLIRELLTRNLRHTWNIVYWFFRIEFSTLPTGFIKNINEMSFHVQQAKFKNGKQTNGSGADNDGICFNCFGHNLTFQSIFNLHNYYVINYNLPNNFVYIMLLINYKLLLQRHFVLVNSYI